MATLTFQGTLNVQRTSGLTQEVVRPETPMTTEAYNQTQQTVAGVFGDLSQFADTDIFIIDGIIKSDSERQLQIVGSFSKEEINLFNSIVNVQA